MMVSPDGCGWLLINRQKSQRLRLGHRLLAIVSYLVRPDAQALKNDSRRELARKLIGTSNPESLL